MPRKGVTIYDLLISCPGDVTDFLEIIKESVESLQWTYGRNISIL